MIPLISNRIHVKNSILQAHFNEKFGEIYLVHLLEHLAEHYSEIHSCIITVEQFFFSPEKTDLGHFPF